MIDDSPHALMVLMKGHHPGDEPAAGGDEPPDGLEDACKDLMDAIKSGDSKAMAHAFMDCMSMAHGEGTDAEKA